MKPVVFLGDSLDAIRMFPDSPRREAGYQIERMQRGLDPDHWKPMASVGKGVREIRVTDETGAFRVMYVATFADAVHVLHAFQKKTSATARRDIEIATQRFRALVQRKRT